VRKQLNRTVPFRSQYLSQFSDYNQCLVPIDESQCDRCCVSSGNAMDAARSGNSEDLDCGVNAAEIVGDNMARAIQQDEVSLQASSGPVCTDICGRYWRRTFLSEIMIGAAAEAEGAEAEELRDMDEANINPGHVHRTCGRYQRHTFLSERTQF
jgi:hypothetical protein